jgi:hypothetical protein
VNEINLAIFGHFWPFLAIFGHFWPFLAIFGHFWPFLAIFGSFCFQALYDQNSRN